jgi:hypothetical protein
VEKTKKHKQPTTPTPACGHAPPAVERARARQATFGCNPNHEPYVSLGKERQRTPHNAHAATRTRPAWRRRRSTSNQRRQHRRTNTPPAVEKAIRHERPHTSSNIQLSTADKRRKRFGGRSRAVVVQEGASADGPAGPHDDVSSNKKHCNMDNTQERLGDVVGTKTWALLTQHTRRDMQHTNHTEAKQSTTPARRATTLFRRARTRQAQLGRYP